MNQDEKFLVEIQDAAIKDIGNQIKESFIKKLNDDAGSKKVFSDIARMTREHNPDLLPMILPTNVLMGQALIYAGTELMKSERR